MDRISKATRSAIMSRIRGRGNKRTEINVVSLFRKLRIKGWRRHVTICFDESDSPRSISSDGIKFKAKVRPDFVFQKQKVALFIDGCFWHGCVKCYRQPKSRKKFWSAKILRNQERDLFQMRQLKRIGWKALRVREHELSRKNETRLLRRIQKALVKNI